MIMKRALLFLCVFALCASCALSEAASSPAREYAQIDMTDTRSSIAEKLGEGEALDKYVRYGGALCAFFEGGMLRAKLIWFDAPAQITQSVAVNLDAAKRLKQGASMAEVVQAFGCEGVEIMRINLSEDTNAAQQIVYLWRDAQDRVIEALFEYENGELRLFAAVENNPEA